MDALLHIKIKEIHICICIFFFLGGEKVFQESKFSLFLQYGDVVFYSSVVCEWI